MGRINKSDQNFTKNASGNMVIGISQVVLGVLVILFAAFTTWLTIWALGLCLIVWGAIDLAQFFPLKKTDSSWWRFSLGVLASGCGALLLFYPGIGVAAISLVLAILFIMGGLYKIFGALTDRPVNWGWVVLGGGLSIILGFFIFSQWPVDNFLLLGVLVGIEILLNGWTLMAINFASQRVFHHRGGTPSVVQR